MLINRIFYGEPVETISSFVSCFQQQLVHHDFTKFHSLKPKLLEAVDRMLAEDIARLMNMVPQEEMTHAAAHKIQGGVFQESVQSPFGFGRGEGVDEGRGEREWVVSKDRFKYDEMFEALSPIDGKVTGSAAKTEMVKSRLPNTTLGKIWKLADVDKDGMLDADEFALAMHLINVKLEGHDLPSELPEHLLPPSKR